MGIRDNPNFIEYCQQNNCPSLTGYISWINKKYAGHVSQEKQHQHENTISVMQG